MDRIKQLLDRASLAALAAVILVAPWLFGAWEAWWFWLGVAGLCLAGLLFAARLLLTGIVRHSRGISGLRRRERGPAREAAAESRAWRDGLRAAAVLGFAPFLLYALLRFPRADVFPDAQRSFLLFFTPFLVGVQVAFGCRRRQLRRLHLLIMVDLLLLGLYGILNHAFDHSRHVLWVPGYPQYAGRATGTYFCPDHFAGIMEIGFALALGVLLARESGRALRAVAAALAAVAVAGVILSQSRGGGLALLVTLAAALAWGFGQWPPLRRWAWRLGLLGGAALAVVLFVALNRSYTERFGQYFGWEAARDKAWPERKAHLLEQVRLSDRGRMAAAALRAWRTQPWRGIGPGMHQHLWPHVAPSPDGDRARGLRPSLLNNDYYSYEVHDDWLQLLEEYGLIGLILFAGAGGTVFGVMLWGLRRERLSRVRHGWGPTGRPDFGLVLGGVLAAVALGFHAFGDFNLQMPATVWLLAAVVAVAAALATAAPGRAEDSAADE